MKKFKTFLLALEAIVVIYEFFMFLLELVQKWFFL